MDAVRLQVLVQAESRLVLAQRVGMVLVLLGTLIGGLEVGDVDSHALKAELVGVVGVEPGAFGPVALVSGYELRVVPNLLRIGIRYRHTKLFACLGRPATPSIYKKSRERHRGPW